MKRIAKSRKKTWKAVLISIAVVTVAFGVAYAVSIGHLKSSYNYKLAKLSGDMEKNRVTAYVATQDIPAGTELSEDDLQVQSVYHQGGTSEELITDEDIGKIAVADITAGKPIYKSMIGSKLADGMREAEYACLQLSTNLKEHDFVDVRIWYPNGENYIVLSKVSLKKLKKSKNDCFLWLDEKQIMMMSSAIVDAYMHTGSILYTTKYIEDGQKEVSTNYVPTKACITAMANDTNIVSDATDSLSASVREALDSRLNEKDESKQSVDLTQIIPGYSEEDTSDDGSQDTGDGSETDSGTSTSDSSTDSEGGDTYE